MSLIRRTLGGARETAVVWLVLGAAIVLGVAHPVRAQWTVTDTLSYDRGPLRWDCGLRKVDVAAFVNHRAEPTKQKKGASTILVDYSRDFPLRARSAFERAVAIWEAHISSRVTIRIDARFEDLGRGVLAGAGPKLIVVDTTGNRVGDLIIGSPLADARTGTDQLPGETDVVVTFNSEREDWHYDSEAAPAEKIDFTTVALHEIVHGLNYIDLFRVSGVSGVYGVDFNRNGRIDADERFPGVYGNQLVERRNDGTQRLLTDTQTFQNPSPALGDALTGDHLYFAGEEARQAARDFDGSRAPKIYAPNRFVRGSSIAHLDEETYSSETANALMTPRLKRAETIRRPGAIICGQLIDMGWEPGPGCAREGPVLSAARGDVKTGQVGPKRSVNLRWQLRGRASSVESVDEFVVEQKRYATSEAPEPFRKRATVRAEGAGEYSISFDDVNVGTHTFRVTAPGGGISSITTTVEVRAERTDVSLYPNPFTTSTNVSFVLRETQHVKVEVFDALGKQVANPYQGIRPAHTARPIVLDGGRLSNLSSGIYFFRVTGETFTAVEKAVRVQ